MERKPNATKTYFFLFLGICAFWSHIFFVIKDDYNVVKANAEKM